MFLSGKRPKKDARIKELEEENRKLKEALACQTQELMLLKKRMKGYNQKVCKNVGGVSYNRG